jgi:hypothetical protein
VSGHNRREETQASDPGRTRAESRVLAQAAPAFDEFQVLRFRAENTAPFVFEWVDYVKTAKEYGALLIRVSREYDQRFR